MQKMKEINKKPKTATLKIHKTSYLLLASLAVVVALLFLAPTFATSTNPCSTCHGSDGFSQTLTITASQIPDRLDIGQTATVTATIQNTVDVATSNDILSGVSATLASQNGRFTVGSTTVSAGSLSSDASAVVSWQITAVSAGSDALVIKASALNSHNNLKFADSVSPAPSITISAPPTPTPAPTPTTTPAPTPVPTPVATPTPTPAPTIAPTPVPTQTPAPTPAPTPVPTLAPTPTTAPTPPVATPTPTPAPTIVPTPTPTQTPLPTSDSNTTPTPAPTPTPTPIASPQPTPAPTQTPTPTPNPTAKPQTPTAPTRDSPDEETEETHWTHHWNRKLNLCESKREALHWKRRLFNPHFFDGDD